MKKLILALLLITVVSCGQMNKSVEQMSYTTLTGKTGDITLYSGDSPIATYEDVEITYSNSDSQALFFTHDGQNHYWQGDALVKLD